MRNEPRRSGSFRSVSSISRYYPIPQSKLSVIGASQTSSQGPMWSAIKGLFQAFLPRPFLQRNGTSAALLNTQSNSLKLDEQSMVTTRSQDRASQDHASEPPPLFPVEKANVKRKHGVDTATSGIPPNSKRRRSSKRVDGDPSTEDVAVFDSQTSDESSPRKLALRPHGSPDLPRNSVERDDMVEQESIIHEEGALGAEETQVVEETQLPNVEGEPVGEMLDETLLTSPKSSSPMALPAYAQQVVESTQELEPHGATESDGDADIDVAESNIGLNGRVSRNMTQSHPSSPRPRGIVKDIQMVKEPTTNGAAPARAQHVRFGSNEPTEPESTIATSNGHDKHPSLAASEAQAPVDTSDDDDDAAPETISKSAGQAQALAATTEAARAAKL